VAGNLNIFSHHGTKVENGRQYNPTFILLLFFKTPFKSPKIEGYHRLHLNIPIKHSALDKTRKRGVTPPNPTNSMNIRNIHLEKHTLDNLN
jgi:hypothetical protein